MHGLYLHREQEQRQPELINPERWKFLEFKETIYGTEEELFTEAANKALFEQHNRRVRQVPPTRAYCIRIDVATHLDNISRFPLRYFYPLGYIYVTRNLVALVILRGPCSG